LQRVCERGARAGGTRSGDREAGGLGGERDEPQPKGEIGIPLRKKRRRSDRGTEGLQKREEEIKHPDFGRARKIPEGLQPKAKGPCDCGFRCLQFLYNGLSKRQFTIPGVGWGRADGQGPHTIAPATRKHQHGKGRGWTEGTTGGTSYLSKDFVSEMRHHLTSKQPGSYNGRAQSLSLPRD